MPSLDELCNQIIQIKAAQKRQAEILDQKNAEVMSRLDELGLHSTKTEGGHQITVVRSSTKEWDLTVLKDILWPLGLWGRVAIVKEELDRAALEVCLDQHKVTEEALLPALTVKERKPYPKIS